MWLKVNVAMHDDPDIDEAGGVAWVVDIAVGMITKQHGFGGKVLKRFVRPKSIAKMSGLDTIPGGLEAVTESLRDLVTIGYYEIRGEFLVMVHWKRTQGDPTAAERQARKRMATSEVTRESQMLHRGEERRGEESRREPPVAPRGGSIEEREDDGQETLGEVGRHRGREAGKLASAEQGRVRVSDSQVHVPEPDHPGGRGQSSLQGLDQSQPEQSRHNGVDRVNWTAIEDAWDLLASEFKNVTKHKRPWLEAWHKKLKLRAKELKQSVPEAWEEALAIIRKSPFARGDVKPGNGHRQFVLKASWLVKPENWRKVTEGDYVGEVVPEFTPAYLLPPVEDV